MSIKSGLPRFCLCLLLLAILAGCGSGGAENVGADDVGNANPSATSQATVPDTLGAPEPPKQLWLAASHILIQYAGSAPPSLHFTQTQ